MALVRINRNPSARDLRVFAAICVSLVTLAAVTCYRKEEYAPALILGVVAGAAAVIAVVRPRLWLPLFIFASYVTYPIGFVVSFVLLGVIYFVVLTPLGLLLRAFRYDALLSKFDRSASTYWSPRSKARPPQDYFRQI